MIFCCGGDDYSDLVLGLVACPEERFNELCKHQVARFIKSLKEINIAFTPSEQQVLLTHT